MRVTFVQTLLDLIKTDRKICLLTGDLGFSVFEQLQKDFPRNYLNVGVAEQNMTGVAAGMALEGLTPIIYSIVPFVTMRNFEQIRNDICYQNLNVKIVGVGAGFSYGNYGHTHHGLEDIGVLRTLPGMTIIAPGDPLEVKLATRAMLRHAGPVYLRLGKAGEPTIHGETPHFVIGKGIIVNEGTDVTIFATSTLLGRGKEITEELKERNIFVRLISMHTIKPIDKRIIIDAAKKTSALFTLEEHSVIGGLGSAVAEVLSEAGVGTTFMRIGVPDRFTKAMGSQEYMRKENGLSVAQISRLIQKIVRKGYDTKDN